MFDVHPNNWTSLLIPALEQSQKKKKSISIISGEFTENLANRTVTVV